MGNLYAKLVGAPPAVRGGYVETHHEILRILVMGSESTINISEK
jgi:hypothetical protein